MLHRRAAKRIVAQAGTLLLERRDAEMRRLLQPAVARYPKDPELRLLYATSLVPVDRAAAAEHAADVLELSPDDSVCLTRAATLLYDVGRADLAAQFLARVAALDQTGFSLAADVANLEGKLAAEAGDTSLAEARLRAALEMQPHEYFFAQDLVRFLERTGQKQAAQSLIDERIRRFPEEREKLAALRTELGNTTSPD